MASSHLGGLSSPAGPQPSTWEGSTGPQLPCHQCLTSGRTLRSPVGAGPCYPLPCRAEWKWELRSGSMEIFLQGTQEQPRERTLWPRTTCSCTRNLKKFLIQARLRQALLYPLLSLIDSWFSLRARLCRQLLCWCLSQLAKQLSPSKRVGWRFEDKSCAGYCY